MSAPNDPRTMARQSYPGKRMTQGEFDDAYAITGVLAREIKRSGSFYEARENYAFAFAKGKQISTDQAQKAIGEIFAARFGQTMNQMREDVIRQDAKIGPEQAARYAQQVGPLIKDGETMPFYRAYDKASHQMAGDHGITQTRAKELMTEAHSLAQPAKNGQSLYNLGKELEEAYHYPKIEAERTARKVKASQNRDQKHAQKIT